MDGTESRSLSLLLVPNVTFEVDGDDLSRCLSRVSFIRFRSRDRISVFDTPPRSRYISSVLILFFFPRKPALPSTSPSSQVLITQVPQAERYTSTTTNPPAETAETISGFPKNNNRGRLHRDPQRQKPASTWDWRRGRRQQKRNFRVSTRPGRSGDGRDKRLPSLSFGSVLRRRRTQK